MKLSNFASFIVLVALKISEVPLPRLKRVAHINAIFMVFILNKIYFVFLDYYYLHRNEYHLDTVTVAISKIRQQGRKSFGFWKFEQSRIKIVLTVINQPFLFSYNFNLN